MSQTDGGPAFPLSLPRIKENGKDNMAGMTLRDWFAGQALAGICVMDELPTKHVTVHAYQVADWMLAARENKQ